MKYVIFYKQTQIGTLYINDKEEYKYVPNIEVLEEIKKEVSLIHEMCIETPCQEPIPFFKNRIEDSKKIGKREKIGRHTDNFSMLLAD